MSLGNSCKQVDKNLILNIYILFFYIPRRKSHFESWTIVKRGIGHALKQWSWNRFSYTKNYWIRKSFGYKISLDKRAYSLNYPSWQWFGFGSGLKWHKDTITLREKQPMQNGNKRKTWYSDKLITNQSFKCN